MADRQNTGHVRAQANRLLAERMIEGETVGRRVGEGERPARSVTVNLAESPLGWLLARGLIGERQFEAGERIRSDWERANLAPSITMRWDAAPRSGVRRGSDDHLEPGERQMAARKRFDSAMAALGRDLNDIAWRVICSGEAMPVAEKALGWPVRSGRLVLRLALDRLADFYRLPG
ncbi:hypothetical protein C7451_101305 [Blastomonas natatoria]|uniref:DUF6456 domain-containing protein n=1 Tax=Blastomonas natatoria TaxID=34015 RepID=A0A2V3VEI1_9SPHN|nr:DUF6456 domain-containing protein [Blastomonas natatoria]PXW79241.1 hypothetical protein C7451_101305 [Blastomonas natatoria]